MGSGALTLRCPSARTAEAKPRPLTIVAPLARVMCSPSLEVRVCSKTGTRLLIHGPVAGVRFAPLSPEYRGEGRRQADNFNRIMYKKASRNKIVGRPFQAVL